MRRSPAARCDECQLLREIADDSVSAGFACDIRNALSCARDEGDAGAAPGQLANQREPESECRR